MKSLFYASLLMLAGESICPKAALRFRLDYRKIERSRKNVCAALLSQFCVYCVVKMNLRLENLMQTHKGVLKPLAQSISQNNKQLYDPKRSILRNP